MSLAFWRPGPPGYAAQWWSRCDSCHWSGPTARFTWYKRGDDHVSICDHYWCRNDNQLVEVLLHDGWEEVS